MKTIFALILLSLCIATAPAQDSWTGSDKKLHFGVSTISGFVARSFFPNEPIKAIGLALVPGLLKELSDSRDTGNKFSGKDMTWNFLGALTGSLLYGWGWSGNRITYTTPF